MTTYSHILACRTSCTEGTGGLQSIISQRVGYDGQHASTCKKRTLQVQIFLSRIPSLKGRVKYLKYIFKKKEKHLL